jgi:hypothetical protein
MLSEICAGKTVIALAGTKEQVYVRLKTFFCNCSVITFRDDHDLLDLLQFQLQLHNSSTIEGTVKSLNLGTVMKNRDVLKNKGHLQLTVAWDHVIKYNLTKIERIQQSATKHITGSNLDKERLELLELLPLSYRREV